MTTTVVLASTSMTSHNYHILGGVSFNNSKRFNSTSLGLGPCADEETGTEGPQEQAGEADAGRGSCPGPLTTILAASPGSLAEVWLLRDSVSSSVERAASEKWGLSDRLVFSRPSLQCPERAPRMSSAARMGSASPWISSVIRIGTVWTGPTRRPAPCPPAAPPASSATTLPASPSCGLVTATPTARMAQMSGRNAVGAATRQPPNRTMALARPSNSTAGAANASTPAGAVTAALTARTSPTRRTAVRPPCGGPRPCPCAPLGVGQVGLSVLKHCQGPPWGFQSHSVFLPVLLITWRRKPP